METGFSTKEKIFHHREILHGIQGEMRCGDWETFLVGRGKCERCSCIGKSFSEEGEEKKLENWLSRAFINIISPDRKGTNPSSSDFHPDTLNLNA